MNLIRNGGFERGDLRHWTIETADTLSVDVPNSHRGGFCGKLTAVTGATATIHNNECIKVNAYENITLGCMIKSAAARLCIIYAVEYDSDLNEIGSHSINRVYSTAAYAMHKGEYTPTPDGVYVMMRVAVAFPTAGEIFYIDDAYAMIYPHTKGTFHEEEICNLTAISTSGDTDDTLYSMRGDETYIADLRVSNVGGVNPTLDVEVYDTSIQIRPALVGTFAQAVTAGEERIGLTLPTGSGFYVKYVVGGTNPLFSFRVGITGKR